MRPIAIISGILALLFSACSSSPEWSDDRVASPEAGADGVVHGYFKAEPLTVTTSDIPSHTFVRVRFKLIMKGSSDAGTCIWGPDLIGCRVRGGEQLFMTSFSNPRAKCPSQTQSYPDDYPWADQYGFTGGRPFSDHRFLTPDSAISGAIADSVYDYDMIFPHAGEQLALDFAPFFTDRKRERQCWAISGFSCEVAPPPTPLTTRELESLWARLADADSTKAVVAMWEFIALGSTAEDFLLEKAHRLPPPWCRAGDFYASQEGLRVMRLQRALRLIGTRSSVAESDNILDRRVPEQSRSTL